LDGVLLGQTYKGVFPEMDTGDEVGRATWWPRLYDGDDGGGGNDDNEGDISNGGADKKQDDSISFMKPSCDDTFSPEISRS